MHKPRLDNPDLPVADIMRLWPETIPVFLERGMLCVGCMIGPFHTLEDVCAEYGIETETLLAELRSTVRSAAGPAVRAGAAEER
jgi:hybrid cluster-associated redox disulfide protein